MQFLLDHRVGAVPVPLLRSSECRRGESARRAMLLTSVPLSRKFSERRAFIFIPFVSSCGIGDGERCRCYCCCSGRRLPSLFSVAVHGFVALRGASRKRAESSRGIRVACSGMARGICVSYYQSTSPATLITGAVADCCHLAWLHRGSRTHL